jgi:tetratricopeptide (TPR) repeat protein
MSFRLGRLVSSPVRHPGRWAGGLLLLTVLALAAWRAADYWNAHRHRREAENALAHYDFDGAREHLAALLKLRPRDAEARLLAAQAARRAGFYDEAEEHLDAYHDLPDRSAAEGALERALLSAQRGGLPQVQEYLLSCLDLHHPASNLILEALALGASEVYRPDEAYNWLQQLLELEPCNVPALIKRGQMYESVLKMDAALEDYRKAVECEPEHFKARLQLADMLRRRKEPAEAVEYFVSLRQRYPDRADVLLGLARCRLELDEPEEAVRVLDDLVKRHPDDGAALLEWGRLDLEAGRLTDAEQRLRRAVALLPWDRDANYQLARCLRRQGQRDEADVYLARMGQIEADLKRLLEVYPLAFKNRNDPAPRLEAGLICMRNGQEAEGLRWLHGALQIDPNHRATHDALADYYERHGDTTRARLHRQKGSNSAFGGSK